MCLWEKTDGKEMVGQEVWNGVGKVMIWEASSGGECPHH